jgi:transposase
VSDEWRGRSLLASSLLGAIDEEKLAAALVVRGELRDKAWEQIVLLLPESGRRAQQWKDHRKVINGILWKLRTGAPWRDLPPRYGSWQTCYDRFVRWRRDGIWDRLLANAQTTPVRWVRWSGR